MSKTLIDIKDNKYGLLTVVEYIGNKKWKCICDCGNVAYRTGRDLKRSITPSCGCRKAITARENGRKALRHGLSKDRRYHIWQCMKHRCNYAKDKSYANYGGRGIKVCDEWNNDFNAFLKWCNESGYADDKTIDRIDVNGNYQPSNCRWVSILEQENNRRNNVIITYNNEQLTASQWGRKLGISDTLIRRRYTSGWKTEDILFTEADYRNRKAKKC